jgi:hypothetical protein
VSAEPWRGPYTPAGAKVRGGKTFLPKDC